MDRLYSRVHQPFVARCLALTMLAGNFGSGDQPTEDAAPVQSNDEAQRLDALGYLDFASEPAQ